MWTERQVWRLDVTGCPRWTEATSIVSIDMSGCGFNDGECDTYCRGNHVQNSRMMVRAQKRTIENSGTSRSDCQDGEGIVSACPGRARFHE